MAQVKTVFTSDDKEVARALDKLNAAMEKLRKENAELRNETKKHHSEFKEGLKEASIAFVPLLGQLHSVEGAIDFIRDGYREWRAEIREANAEHNKLSADIIRSLVQIGQMRNADRVERALSELGGFTTKEEGAQIFAGVTGGAPNVGIGRQLAVTRAIAPAAGEGRLDPVRLGQIAGAFAGSFQGRTPEQIGNLAIRAQQAAGISAGQLGDPGFLRAVQGLVAAGMSPEQALAMGVEDLRQNQSPKALLALAGAVTGEIKPVEQKRKRGHAVPFTPAEAAQNALAALPAGSAERLRMLLNDPNAQQAMLGDIGALGMAQLDRQAIAGMSTEFGRPGAAKEILEQLQTTGGGQRVLGRAAAGVRAEEGKEVLAKQGDDVAAARQALQTALNSNNVGFIDRMIANLGFEGLTGLGFSGRGAIGFLNTPLPGIANPPFIGQAAEALGRQERGEDVSQLIKSLDENTESNHRNAEATEKNTQTWRDRGPRDFLQHGEPR